MRRRLDEIKDKGFNMSSNLTREPEIPYGEMTYAEFNKMKVGLQSLDDAVLNLGSLKTTNKTLADKATILQALASRDYDFLREVSNFFYETSGIYSRLCKYLAYLYRYDWMVIPYVNSDKVGSEKVLVEFAKILNYLDKFEAKRVFGDIALKVMRNGVYYGYRIHTPERVVLQELPPAYCRSRYFANNRPVIEFNMKFFDDNFRDTETRARILKMFPSEFAKGYILFKEGKLKPDFTGDKQGWYMLEPELTVKFSLNGDDYPVLANVIPSLIDLDEAQELDRKKTMQKLLKIVIQKLPFDKNGEMIFDVDEAKDLHNNAVAMLKKAIGVDVLTTFADTEVADLSDKNTTTSTDDLKKVERGVYNTSGVSSGLFNTDGNLALDKSVLNDEAAVYNLLLQFQGLLNDIVQMQFNSNPKKVEYRVEMLPTTIHNYRDMSKLYKEHTTIGYSKMLPQIALGHSQSSILATAHFENEILNLAEIMVPPQMSSTMSNKNLGGSSKSNTNNSNETVEGKVGRTEKPDDQKSEKTIQNRESMN